MSALRAAAVGDEGAGSGDRRVAVEIWSDVVCPWCYLGKRRFEAALARFADGDRVDVVWRAFELEPDAPPEHGESVSALLMRRYGATRAEVDATQAKLAALGEVEGIHYRFDILRPGNARAAHRLVKLAGERGLAGAMHERLMRAHLCEGVLVSDHDELVRLGAEVGLDAPDVRATLAGAAYTDAVLADSRRAARFGIRGVPTFVFEQQFPVAGAQTSDALVAVLTRIWAMPPADPSRRL